MENTIESQTQEPAMAITLHGENAEDFMTAYDEAALRKKAAEEEVAKANEELNEIREKARAAAISKSKAAIIQFGIEPRDLFEDIQIVEKKKRASEKRKYAAPTTKYRGPNGEEWSGRGLTPRWLSALIAAGHTKEEFAITGEKA